jgi:hypothetical protein
MFIAVPTTFCHVSSSWMKQIQSTLLHLISVTSILILSYCLHLRLLIGVSSTFMDKDCVCVSVLFHTCYMTHQPFLSWPDSWYFALIKNYEPVRRHARFFFSLKSKYYRQHPVLRRLSLWSPLHVRRWVRNPCKTTGRGYILCEIPCFVRQEFDGTESD